MSESAAKRHEATRDSVRAYQKLSDVGTSQDLLDLASAEIFSLVDTLPPGLYCSRLVGKSIIIVGSNNKDTTKLAAMAESLGATHVTYSDTDRLLVDVVQENVSGVSINNIVAVLALVDTWPGRRSFVDFSLKMKALIKGVRIATISRYVSSDDFRRLGVPPADAQCQQPLTQCSICRLTSQQRQNTCAT